MTNKLLSSKQVILRIVTIISIVEFSIMNGFEFFGSHLSPYAESIIDIVLLAIFATPLIYVWVINPFIDERDSVIESIRNDVD